MAPHRDDLHRGTVVDASAGTVVPGLIESHAHLSKALGEALGPHLAVLRHHHGPQPGGQAFEGQEEREAIESGVRIGPRVFTTGEPLDGTRIYYPGGVGARRRRAASTRCSARDARSASTSSRPTCGCRTCCKAGHRRGAPRRDAGDLARDLSGRGLRRRRRRAHPRHQPPRLLAEEQRPAPHLPGRHRAADRVGDDADADHRHPGRQPAADAAGRSRGSTTRGSRLFPASAAAAAGRLRAQAHRRAGPRHPRGAGGAAGAAGGRGGERRRPRDRRHRLADQPLRHGAADGARALRPRRHVAGRGDPHARPRWPPRRWASARTSAPSSRASSPIW